MTLERVPPRKSSAPADTERGLFVLRLGDAVPEAERAAVARRIAASAQLDASRVRLLLHKEPGSALVRPIPLALVERVQGLFEAAGASTYITPVRSEDDAAHRFRATMQRRREALQEAAEPSDSPPVRSSSIDWGRDSGPTTPTETAQPEHPARPAAPGLRPTVVLLALGAGVAAIACAFLPAYQPADAGASRSYLGMEGSGGGAVLIAALATAVLTLARRYWAALALALSALFVAGYDFVQLTFAGGSQGAAGYGWIPLFAALALALLAARLGLRARGRS